MSKNEDLLLAIIKKGGSIPQNKPSTRSEKEMSEEEFREYYSEIKPYLLKMPRWLMKRIDEATAKHKPAYMSRQNWIIDAIINKLVEENK